MFGVWSCFTVHTRHQHRDMQRFITCKHYLGNGEAGNGEAGDDIGTEEFEAIVGAPLKNGEQELKSKKKLGERWLVFETVQRIIREEDFRESLFEFEE